MFLLWSGGKETHVTCVSAFQQSLLPASLLWHCTTLASLLHSPFLSCCLCSLCFYLFYSVLCCILLLSCSFIFMSLSYVASPCSYFCVTFYSSLFIAICYSHFSSIFYFFVFVPSVLVLSLVGFSGSPKGWGLPGCGPTNPQKQKFKKTDFVDIIKRFTWFPLQLESATEIGLWLVHYNFEK
jgi:hypothetical protein